MVNFQFSPNPNQAHQIHWFPWSAGAFAKAQAENKPVLLSLSAVWCYWCHVMDESSYSDPDVVRYINEQFVAIRVDSDRRPDINTRYNVGGWPTTAFLTGHGGLVAGATYLPPDQFLAMLMEVQRAYREQKPELYDRAGDLLRQRREQVGQVAAGGELKKALVDRIARRVAGAYDAFNGGFGVEPKFPGAPVLQFLVHLFRTTGEDFYRVMLEKTLDRMANSEVFDWAEGGFFRYCAKSDWSEAQHEKMLEDNLGLARVYLDAYMVLGKEKYHQVASHTIDYLLGQLFDNRVPGFHGSQGAHSDYFGLPLVSRRERPVPPVDPSFYTNWNTQAVSLLLDASWMLPRPELAQVALGILETIDTMARSDRLSHVYGDPPGVPACEGGTTWGVGEPAFLTDWAHLLNALMDAYNHTSQPHYLERARDVASEVVGRFADSRNGGFFDIEEDQEALGYLRVREKPLPENAAVAQGLLKLHHATHNDDYQQVAQATLSAYVDAHRDHGEFASSYAVAVHLLLNSPVEIAIEGHLEDAGTRAMLMAAARTHYPHIIIKPLPAFGVETAARAHLCLDTVCLPPISDPDALEGAVANMLSPQVSPFENILERFTTF